MEKIQNEFYSILIDLEAGPTCTIDLSFNPATREVKENKHFTNPAQAVEVYTSLDDFEPDCYGEEGNKFLDLIEQRFGIIVD